MSSALKVAVSTFSASSFTTPASSFSAGQTAYVKALVTLQDGTPVTTGTATFELTGSSIASAPVTMAYDPSLGAWTGSYTVLQSDQAGNQVLTVSASDGRGNAGSGTQTVGVNSPVTTSAQGLEASITFDPATHDIVVSPSAAPAASPPRL